jgi:hypothetical protein
VVSYEQVGEVVSDVMVPGALQTSSWGMNDAAMIVGTYMMEVDGGQQAFIMYPDGAVETFPAPARYDLSAHLAGGRE